MGDAFALIRIPRFGKKYVKPIYQGTELPILDKGVGHYTKSQMPGEIGNFAVAGHRVTYGKPFNEIATIKPGDAIVVETATTWYVYRAVRHVIVTPDHVEVVAPVPQHPGATPTVAWMTMTACNPEYSARERYVEFSKLEQVLPKSKRPDPGGARRRTGQGLSARMYGFIWRHLPGPVRGPDPARPASCSRRSSPYCSCGCSRRSRRSCPSTTGRWTTR